MFGGERTMFEQVRPALDAMGSEAIYMGCVGSGQLARLANQLLFNISVAAIAEVLPMAVKLVLDPERVLQVVTTSTGNSYAAGFFGPRILEGRFEEGYPLQTAYKDMISAAEIGANDQIPLPLVHAATTTYQMALVAGLVPFHTTDPGSPFARHRSVTGGKALNRAETARSVTWREPRKAKVCFMKCH